MRIRRTLLTIATTALTVGAWAVAAHAATGGSPLAPVATNIGLMNQHDIAYTLGGAGTVAIAASQIKGLGINHVTELGIGTFCGGVICGNYPVVAGWAGMSAAALIHLTPVLHRLV